jgi:hypothetical protein
MASEAHLQARLQILRISCSDIGGLTGFNPFVDFQRVFQKYLYQDLSDLQLLDAENLGLELISPEDEVERLVQKLDAEDGAEMKAIENKIRNDENLDGNTKATRIIHDIKTVMAKAAKKMKMSTVEVKHEGSRLCTIYTPITLPIDIYISDIYIYIGNL